MKKVINFANALPRCASDGAVGKAFVSNSGLSCPKVCTVCTSLGSNSKPLQLAAIVKAK